MLSFDRRRKILWMFALVPGMIGPIPGCAPRQEVGKCFLWKASSTSNTIYVLGSMHVASPDIYPLPPEIEEIFAKSKKLVVEVDMESADKAKLQSIVFKKGMYAQDTSLSKNLSKGTMDALREHCNKKGLKIAMFEPMRPWVVNLTVYVMELQALGLTPESGIDAHFLKKAQAAKMPIVELENLEEQLELFAGLSSTLQENQLAKTLGDQSELKSTLDKIVAAWKNGDVKAMEQLVLVDPLMKHPEYKALLEKMFDDRNAKMIPKIEEFLKGDEPVFVMVRAFHLVGPKGILKLLEERNYQVSQVARTSAVK